MEYNNKTLLFIIAILGVLAYLHYNPNTSNIIPTKEVTSLYENDLPWDTPFQLTGISFSRAIFQIDTSQIDPNAEYVWVDIQLPQQFIDDLTNLYNIVNQYNPNWTNSLLLPPVLNAKRNTYQDWTIINSDAVVVSQTDPNGIPTELKVRIHKVNGEWYPFLIVYIPFPLYDDFRSYSSDASNIEWNIEDLSGYTYMIASYEQLPVYSKGGYLKITPESYHRSLLLTPTSSSDSYIILSKNVNVSIIPNLSSPISIDYSTITGYYIDYGYSGRYIYLNFIIEVLGKNAQKYFIRFIGKGGDSNGWQYGEQIINNAILYNSQNVCNITIPAIGASDSTSNTHELYYRSIKYDLLDLLSDCGIDPNQVSRIDKVYIVVISKNIDVPLYISVHGVQIGDTRIIQ